MFKLKMDLFQRGRRKTSKYVPLPHHDGYEFDKWTAHAQLNQCLDLAARSGPRKAKHLLLVAQGWAQVVNNLEEHEEPQTMGFKGKNDKR